MKTVNIKHLFRAFALNVIGIFTAIFALIALSYTEAGSLGYPMLFVGILGICGILSTRILLTDCISKRPWKEAVGITFAALILGCALNYAILSLIATLLGVSDFVVAATSLGVGVIALVIGGFLYIYGQKTETSKIFYFGVILWQSLNGILAMGFIAYFLWSWSWLEQ